MLKDQGVNILLNLFAGPVLNAARGVATTVNGAVANFAKNFMTAINPQITKSYASNDHEYVGYLVERGSRFSYYILMFLAIPILLETDFLLTVWLKQYPEHTVNFVRLVIILSMVDTLSNSLITLQNATGKIRNYQLAVGGILLLNFPLSYLCLEMGLEPESTYVVAIVIAVFCLFARLLFVRKTTALSMSQFLKNVVLNVILVTAVSVVLPLLCHSIMPAGWTRFLCVGSVSVISASLSIVYVGCSAGERSFLFRKIKSFISRANDKGHE